MPEMTLARPSAGLPPSADPAARGFKQLLFINEYPPCSVAGGPVIARQLLRNYDPARMDIICCASWYPDARPQMRETYLPCNHVAVPTHRTSRRPRRFFGPWEASLDCGRLDQIIEMGRKIIQEKKVEALFTMSYGCEMPHAAYFLHKEFGIPLYYFETDDLIGQATCRRAYKMITKHREDFLNSVSKLWLTSPAMVRTYRERYGVEGEFLFHFVDMDYYLQSAMAAPSPPTDRISIIYTGSVNQMFYDTMKWFCDRLNRGLTIDGKPVEMTIYSGACPPELLGPHVTWPGLVKLEEIPGLLGQAHLAAILVSFTQNPTVKELIQTSLYTKTIDYLAAGRPVLVVSPTYSSEVDYFGDVTCMVDKAEEEPIVAAIRRILNDREYTEKLRRDGLELVRRQHSLEALENIFLRHFREDA
jgi:glycosyltransferase involved in cell wall biosynthesis